MQKSCNLYVRRLWNNDTLPAQQPQAALKRPKGERAHESRGFVFFKNQEGSHETITRLEQTSTGKCIALSSCLGTAAVIR